MSADSWQALWLTMRLAALTTGLLLLISIPLSWWLSRWQSKFKPLLQAIIAVPLVLPPTVLGFYLLVAFSPQNWFGQSVAALTGVQLAFSFSGIVIGSMIYSLPFAVQPLYQAFRQINPVYLDAATSLGLSGKQRFWHIVLPLAKGGVWTAAGLVFAHTLGEFGVVLMIGGNIPGETRVMSVALFDQVESLNFSEAGRLAGVMLLISVCLMTLLYAFNGRRRSSP